MGSNQQNFNNLAYVPSSLDSHEIIYIPYGKYDTLADCKDDCKVKDGAFYFW